MEATWVLYEFASWVLLFPSQLTYLRWAGHSYQEHRGHVGKIEGKQGGHVGASNTLPNDAVYEKAFVFHIGLY